MNKFASDNGKKNWAHILFVEHPDLFLPELEALKDQTIPEVDGLCKIFEEFQIFKKSRILDLSCGIGRHAIELAARGYQVVGYDPSNFFIDKAKSLVKSELDSQDKYIKFYQGQIHDVAKVLSDYGEGGFNAIISMFNSIGYTTIEDDLKLFKDILGLTCTDGIIVVQTENRDWRLRNFLPFVNYDYGNIQLYESWKFNLERSTAESISRYYERDLEDNSLRLLLDLPTYMRIYSLHEIITILKNTGWVFQKSYGSIQKFAPVSLDSSDIITIGRRGCE